MMYLIAKIQEYSYSVEVNCFLKKFMLYKGLQKYNYVLLARLVSA